MQPPSPRLLSIEYKDLQRRVVKGSHGRQLNAESGADCIAQIHDAQGVQARLPCTNTSLSMSTRVIACCCQRAGHTEPTSMSG